MRVLKLRSTPNANALSISYNESALAKKGEKIEDFNDPDRVEWTNLSGRPDVVVGTKVCPSSYLGFPSALS